MEDEIQGKPKSFIILSQAPSHAVVERKVEVENVLQKFTDLKNINDGDSIGTIYIFGNPGCGKSQVAREVGRQFFEREAAKNEITIQTCSDVIFCCHTWALVKGLN